jgi:protein O-mannosyl-transferase
MAKLNRQQLFAAICFGLMLVTAGVYWPMRFHEFICFDDDAYIIGNSHVNTGLTWSGAVWAFRNGYIANWHPLTWLSHMLDCQVYGLNPSGHHLTNLLCHIANTLLLFIWLNQLTRAVWRSALVAALFAWHPVHVESVAWAAERKDVLSAFFWLLALIAYTRYAQKRSRAVSALDPRLSTLDYLLALFFFACGLMSKPMVVTLPFVFLLLDFWPLGRVSGFRFQVSGSEPRATPSTTRLILEKLPFFALTLADCVVTYRVQKSAGAVVENVPALSHAANVVLAYARYISMSFWPADLAVLYPYHAYPPAAWVIGTALLLAVWSGLFLWLARRKPYWLVGWLWFLGTLVPTIGIVQVGSQAIADRYLYLPGIGLSIMVAWGLNDLAHWRPRWRLPAILAGTAALAGCLAATRMQLGYWQNSLKLLSHTAAITTDNYSIYNSLGAALELAGQKNEALLLYDQAIKIEPQFQPAQYNLGMALLRRGWPEKAREHLAVAVKLTPDDARAHYALGSALAGTGNRDEAIVQFTETLRLDPGSADAHSQLALIFLQQGKTNGALAHFAEVVRLQPGNPEARFNYGLALLDRQQPAEAAVQFAEELRLKPETRAHYRLAQALQQQNRPAEAVPHYREALRLTPGFPEAKKELDEILAAHPELR